MISDRSTGVDLRSDPRLAPSPLRRMCIATADTVPVAVLDCTSDIAGGELGVWSMLPGCLEELRLCNWRVPLYCTHVANVGVGMWCGRRKLVLELDFFFLNYFLGFGFRLLEFWVQVQFSGSMAELYGGDEEVGSLLSEYSIPEPHAFRSLDLFKETCKRFYTLLEEGRRKIHIWDFLMSQ